MRISYFAAASMISMPPITAVARGGLGLGVLVLVVILLIGLRAMAMMTPHGVRLGGNRGIIHILCPFHTQL